MNKILKLYLVLLFLIIFSTQANAQSQDILISPSKTIVYESDYGKIIKIKIVNNTKESLKLKPSEVHIDISDELSIDESPDEPFLYFDAEIIEVLPNSKKILEVRTRLDIQKIDVYPAIKFTSLSNDATQLELLEELYSTFIIQPKEANLEYNIKADINTKLPFVYSKSISLIGNISNVGGKFFEPIGNAKIFKDDKLISDKQLTTQIQGILYPGDQKNFKLSISPDKNPLKSIGIYKIEIDIQATPYSKATKHVISTVYIPKEILVASIILLIAIISIVLILKNKKAR